MDYKMLVFGKLAYQLLQREGMQILLNSGKADAFMTTSGTTSEPLRFLLFPRWDLELESKKVEVRWFGDETQDFWH